MKNISKTSRVFWGILITVLWMAAQTAWAQEFGQVTPEELKK